MPTGEILMLGALVLGAAVFIKVLPKLQADMSAAAAGGAAPAATTGGGGAGTWTQVPNTTACPMLGQSCPTVGSNDSTGWCLCSAGATATPAPATGGTTANCSNGVSVTVGSAGCPCCLASGVCQGNSKCSCSGIPCATQTHASSTANKPGSKSSKSAAPKSLGTSVPNAGQAAAQRLAALDPNPKNEVPAKKICPPLVKC